VKKLIEQKVKMTCKNIIVKKMSLLTFVLFLFAPLFFVSAQIIETKPKVIAAPIKEQLKIKQKGKIIEVENDSTAEKSITVDPRVNISLCVSEGKLKVNGWERNEIRAFVGNGTQIGFRVQQKGAQSGSPILVRALGFDPAKETRTGLDECLEGEEIELDVPYGAVINVKGSESETTIDSVRRATVLINGGDIFLNNITQSIEARTYQGDIMVTNSSGAMRLTCTTGNIVTFDVGASEIGDVFKARTSSGAITLQKVGHRQTEASSNSGSVRFNGEFQSGGQYSFSTQNGAILLSIPEKSSFKFNASYGFGVFMPEFSLDKIENNTTPRAKTATGQAGSGDSTLNLKTVSGAIRIKKQ
jgi:hypothetical protein